MGPKVPQLLAFLALASFSAHLQAQANVPESQESVILYVDAGQGDDSNPGSSSQPLRTIQAAAQRAQANNQKNFGTLVIVNAGTYREAVTLLATKGQTAAPITLQAAQTGTAVVSGADIWTGWQASSSNNEIFTHSWPYRWGLCVVPNGWPAGIQDIVRRREMIAVNGVNLTQVLTTGELMAGTFLVDESSGVVSIWPPAGTDMGSAVVEVAVRPTALQIQGQTNLVVRGLAFEYAASCLNQYAVAVGSSTNILVDGDQFSWNNFGGLSTSVVSNLTAQKVFASHNGGLGVGAWKVAKALLQNDESDYNNWRGAQGAFYDWGMGGFKLMMVHGGLVENSVAMGNQAEGLWFDTDNESVTVDDVFLSGNYVANLDLEANEGPLTVRNSRICNGNDIGLLNSDSENVTVGSNTLYNNGTSGWTGQLFVAGKPGGRTVTNWETGQTYLLQNRDLVLSSNLLVGTGSGQNVFGTYIGGADWTAFNSTLTAGSNSYFDGSQPSPFQVTSHHYSFGDWQKLTGQDGTSVFAPPSVDLASVCADPASVPPATPDFQLHLDQSSVSINQGGGTTVGVKVTAVGLSAPVRLTVGELPEGISATLTPASLSSGDSTLKLSDNGAIPGTYPIKVIGTSGGIVHTVTTSVTATGNSSFHLVSGTSSLTLEKGQTTSFDVTVQAGAQAFYQPVSLACTNVPSVLSCSFTPSSVIPGTTAASAILKIAAAPAATATAGPGVAGGFPAWLAMGMPFLALPTLGVVALADLPTKRRWLILALMLLAVLGMAGCAMTEPGNHSSSQPSSQSFLLTITATSGTVKSSANVSITIVEPGGS
jgi:hypothetical protein